jgi:hypothetical protein
MAKHTPGPWQLGDCSLVWTERDKEMSVANARLIAAAPELLEALEGIIDIGKRDLTNPKYDGYFRTAREAILKAKGR